MSLHDIYLRIGMCNYKTKVFEMKLKLTFVAVCMVKEKRAKFILSCIYYDMVGEHTAV